MTASRTEFNFETARSDFKEKVIKDLIENKTENFPTFNGLYSNYIGTETEKKTAADQTLRDLIKDELNKTDDLSMKAIIENVLDIVTISVSIAKQGFSSPSIPFIILGDVFDCITLDACDTVFHYIEERVGIWKSTMFYSAGKNYLLRMCNDLLRRLSQSKNTVFCGRIQLFLARLFPLSEKSALNLVSQFNLENVTIFNKGVESSTLKEASHVLKESENAMQVDGGASELEKPASLPCGIVDHQLYRNIWSLQDMFRYPVQCYTKELWETFTENADAVFRVFSSYKLEEVLRSRGTAQSNQSSTANNVYFSKFLTSEKLTDLQLNDAQFRRQIFTQFLILFRYLTATVKFKGASLVLTDSMKSWITETEPKIYKLLKETPPNGERFAEWIKHLTEREEFWITWKNEGCPSFMKVAKTPPDDVQAPSAKKRKIDQTGSICEEFISGGDLGMGSSELTRLWSLSSDNLAACQNKSREFIPTLQDFFIECVEQNDPKNAIEEQYKSVNQSNFQWKALRLLSHRSQLFFTSQPTNMQFKTVPSYLNSVVAKLAKDFPTPVRENGVKSDKEDDPADDAKDAPESDENKHPEGDEMLDGGDVNDDEEMDDEDSNILNESPDEEQDTATSGDGDKLTSDDVTALASKIGVNWKKLAPHLSLKEKTIKEIEEDSDDVVLQARQTLVTWQDQIGKRATNSLLTQTLKAAGLGNIIAD